MKHPLEVEVLLEAVEEPLENSYLFNRCIGEGGMSKVYLNSSGEAEKFTKFAVFPEFAQYLNREGHRKPLMLSYSGRGEVLLNDLPLNLECKNGNEDINGFMYLIRSLYEGVALKELAGSTNIPQFKDFKFCVDLGGSVYSMLTLGYVAGDNFSKMVKNGKEREDNQKPSLYQVAKCIADIAVALNQVHRKGFVHRDVKPSNIVYSSSSGEATLVDFGLCQHKDNYRVTRPIPRDLRLLLHSGDRDNCGILSGTAGYMSPEQVKAFLSKKEPVKTAKSDIFTLAATAIYGLKGSSAFCTKLSEFVAGMENYNNTNAGIILDETCLSAEGRFLQKLPDNVLNALEQALDEDPRKRSLQPIFESMSDLANKLGGSEAALSPFNEVANFSNVGVTRNEKSASNGIDTYVGDLTFLRSNCIELIADPNKTELAIIAG